MDWNRTGKFAFSARRAVPAAICRRRAAVARHPSICSANKSKLFIYFLISTSFAVCIFCCSVCAENGGWGCRRLQAFEQGVIIGKIIVFEWECMSVRIDEYVSDDWAPISFVFDVKMELDMWAVGWHEFYSWHGIEWNIHIDNGKYSEMSKKEGKNMI